MPRIENSRLVVVVSLFIIGLFMVACGSRAEEPRPTFEPTATFDFTARSEGQDVEVGQAVAQAPTNALEATEPPTPTVVPTEIPSTEIPPTDVPPTEQPPTEAPTEMPTQEPQDTLVGDPDLGEQLFRYLPNPDTQQLCVTCHNPDEPVPGVGPYLYGIANVAGDRVEGQSAEEYLHTSIVNPNAFIAPTQEGGPEAWPENVMPQNWGEVLTDEEINALVAYLMTLDQVE